MVKMEQLFEPCLQEYYKTKLKKYENNKRGELFVLFSKKIEINNYEVRVAAEYDNNRPEYGIYYGIEMNEDVQLNNIDFEKVKSYFLNNWWLKKHPCCSELEGNRIFIKGDKGLSGNHTFWPIWIRLEDYRNVSEAIEASEVIYTYLSNI